MIDERDDEARVRRAGIRTNVVLALVGGLGVAMVVGFAFIGGDRAGTTDPGVLDVGVRWELDGRLDVAIRHEFDGADDGRRVGQVIGPTVLPAGTAQEIVVEGRGRVHVRSTEPVAPTDGVLALDTARLVEVMPSVGATTSDYSVTTPIATHELAATVPPDRDRARTWAWDDLGVGRAPAFEATLEANGLPTAIATTFLLVGGVVALAFAIATTRQVRRARITERQATRRFVVLLVLSGIGFVASAYVAIRFDEAVIAFGLATSASTIARVAPILVFWLVGVWSFLGITGSSARESTRAKIRRERAATPS